MAEAAAKQSDKSPESMEDILQSIKRIIEDDTIGEAKPEAAAEPPATGDVLDLTQVIRDDGSVDALSPLPVKRPAVVVPEPPPAPVSYAPAAEPPRPPAKPAPRSAPKPPTMQEGLVSDYAAQAAAAALKPITQGAQKDYSIPHIPSTTLRNGNTVEDLVLEALKPMLKAWLDEHLPLIVQKIVEKEVKRIVTFHQD